MLICLSPSLPPLLPSMPSYTLISSIFNRYFISSSPSRISYRIIIISSLGHHPSLIASHLLKGDAQETFLRHSSAFVSVLNESVHNEFLQTPMTSLPESLYIPFNQLNVHHLLLTSHLSEPINLWAYGSLSVRTPASTQA